MMWEVRAGTPNELERKRYSTTAPAKAMMRSRVLAAEKIADRYNQTLKRELESIRAEMDSLSLSTMKAGEVRRWSATDNNVNVTYVIEVERIS